MPEKPSNCSLLPRQLIKLEAIGLGQVLAQAIEQVLVWVIELEPGVVAIIHLVR